MNIKMISKAAFMAVFLCVIGCASLSDAINSNEFLVNTSIRQAVAHYIASGDSIEKEQHRALEIYERTERAEKFLEGKPLATYDDLEKAIIEGIDWNGLTLADFLLAQDLLSLFRQSVEKSALSGEILSADARIDVGALLRTARSAAQIYLEQ